MKKLKYVFLVLFVVVICLIPNFSHAAKVKVDKVKGVKVIQKEITSLKVQWKKIKKATGYRIYIYNSNSKKYEYKAQTKNNFYQIKKLKSAKEYKIKIRAYRKINNKKYYGNYSSTILTTTRPELVKKIKTAKVTDNSVFLSWGKVARATGYKIYIYNNSKKKFEEKYNTNANNINIYGLNQLTTYKIKVRAYKILNNKYYYGSYSNIKLVDTKLSSVTGIRTRSASINSICLNWDINPQASGYRIYMYDLSSKSFIYQGETVEHEFLLNDLKYATGYSFKIRAYILRDNERIYSQYSDIYDTATYPKCVKDIKVGKITTSSIELAWDKVNGATGYAVYLYKESGQSFKLYQTTTSNFIKITDLDAAKFYKIYVKAYVVIKDKQYYSQASEIISKKTKSTATSKAGIDVSKHQGKINWQEVKNMGVDFAILRLGWIGNKENHTLDEQFETNYNECKRLNIPIGVYVYCYCENAKTAKEGANWTVEKLKDKTIELPVFIDMEDNSIVKSGKKELSKICVEFNNIISKANFIPGIYANRNWFDNYLDNSLRQKYVCWIAHYTSSEKINYEDSYKIWQYSSKGIVDGINGNVDLNIGYF